MRASAWNTGWRISAVQMDSRAAKAIHTARWASPSSGMRQPDAGAGAGAGEGVGMGTGKGGSMPLPLPPPPPPQAVTSPPKRPRPPRPRRVRRVVIGIRVITKF
ncbi:hypothetical protein GmRootV118_31370 [Variovorax sp. V118]